MFFRLPNIQTVIFAHCRPSIEPVALRFCFFRAQKGREAYRFGILTLGFAITVHMQPSLCFYRSLYRRLPFDYCHFLHRCARIGHHFSFLRLCAVNTADFSFTNVKMRRLQSQKGRFMPEMRFVCAFWCAKASFVVNMAPFLPRDRQNRRQRRIVCLPLHYTLPAPQKSREDSTNYSSVATCDRLPALYKQNNRFSAL